MDRTRFRATAADTGAVGVGCVGAAPVAFDYENKTKTRKFLFP